MQCGRGTGSTITLGCFAKDFTPSSVTYTWRKNGADLSDFIQYPSVQTGNVYTAVSQIQVSKDEWDNWKSIQCLVKHNGGNKDITFQKSAQVTLVTTKDENYQALVCTIKDGQTNSAVFKWKKDATELADFTETKAKKVGDFYLTASVLMVRGTDWDSEAVYTCEVTFKGKTYTKKVSKAPITVTLKQPSPKEVFINNQAKLECVITGKDKTMVDAYDITWQTNGEKEICKEDSSQSGASKDTKISTMICDISTWNTINKVSCSAAKGDLTPVTEELTVHKAGGETPKVKVNILPEEDMNKSDEVSLVCLVSSPVLADHYIAWSEGFRQNNGNYVDGISFPPQKTKNGYIVASVYTTTKDKWNAGTMFNCNVWPAGSTGGMTPHGVSKAMGNAIECDK